jgi:hypothetical protein
MKHYTYDEHYGRLESYRGSSDKLFLTERLTHSDAMDTHLSLTIAKQQLDECYHFHSLKGQELTDDFLMGFNAGKEYMAMGLETLLEDLSMSSNVTLHSGPFPVLTLDHLERDLSSDENVVEFPED